MTRTEKRELLQRLRRDARRITRHFDLTYLRILADNPRAKSRYGLCTSDGEIKIRLNHIRTRRALKYSSLVATLCHELAHLKHFDHSKRFHKFFARVLRWARRSGIYRPGEDEHEVMQEILPRSTCKALGYDGPPTVNGAPVFSPPGHREHLLPWEDAQPAPPPKKKSKKGSSPEQLKLF